MRFAIFAVTLFSVLFVRGAGSTNSTLKQRDLDIIKVAYMNGYLEAIQMDPKDIERLKKDEAVLKQTVEKAADRYLSVINKMNK